MQGIISFYRINEGEGVNVIVAYFDKSSGVKLVAYEVEDVAITQ